MSPPMLQAEIDSALEKIRTERRRVIAEAVDIVKRNNREQFLFLLIHQIHVLRVVRVQRSEQLDNTAKGLCNLATDAYTYALQLVFKHGKSRPRASLVDYERLIKISRFVNNGFETETMLKFLPFERFGERLQHFKIHLDPMTQDRDRSRLFEYAGRHEMDAALRQITWLSPRELFSELFSPAMDDEFRHIFGINTGEVAEFCSAMLDTISQSLNSAEKSMTRTAQDRIDVPLNRHSMQRDLPTPLNTIRFWIISAAEGDYLGGSSFRWR
jgi:hypothetical protein